MANTTIPASAQHAPITPQGQTVSPAVQPQGQQVQQPAPAVNPPNTPQQNKDIKVAQQEALRPSVKEVITQLEERANLWLHKHAG